MIEATMCPVGCFLAGKYMLYKGRVTKFISANIALYVISMVMLYNWIGNTVPINVGTVGIILEGVAYGCFIVPIIVACTSTLPKDGKCVCIYTQSLFAPTCPHTIWISSKNFV